MPRLNERKLHACFEAFGWRPLGFAEGVRAGSWRRSFAENGVVLHQADCLIAAAAAGIEAALATGNPKDFPMAGLVVEHWPSGG